MTSVGLSLFNYSLYFLSGCILFHSGLDFCSDRLTSRQMIFRPKCFITYRNVSFSRQTQLLLSETPCHKIINTFTLTDAVKLRNLAAFHASDHSTVTLLIMKYYILSFNSFYHSRCCKRKLLTCLLISVLINVKVIFCPTTETALF